MIDYSLIGLRVCVRAADGDHYGVLRYLKQGAPVLADERGHEFMPLDPVEVTDARLACAQCGARVNKTYDHETGSLCAACERVWAARQPVPNEQCEEEGCETRAFYSPAAKKFRCAQHHAAAGSLSGIGAEARVLASMNEDVAECKGADTDDPRHRWVQIKGKRWHCKFCPARRFTDPALGTLYKP